MLMTGLEIRQDGGPHLKTVLNVVMTAEGEEAAQQLVDRQGQAVDVVGVTLHTIGQAFKRGERFCSINPRYNRFQAVFRIRTKPFGSGSGSRNFYVRNPDPDPSINKQKN